jgi:hypothetical protein
VIRPPSAQKQWDAFWSGDPAFIQPPERPAEVTGEYTTALEQYLAKLNAARETGDWRPMLIDGQTPTKFVMGQVDRETWREVADRCGLPSDNPRHIGDITLNSIMFRLSVKSVVGLGDIRVERSPDMKWDGWVMAQRAIVSELDEISPGIIGELGGEVFKRLQGVRPL